MRRAALCLAAAIGVLSAGLVPSGVAQEESAGQSGLVGVGDGVVTIDVPIQFAVLRFPFGGEAPPTVEVEEMNAWLEKFEADVEKFLNDALADLSFEDCYRFEVDVHPTWADGGFSTVGEGFEAHHIWLNFGAGFRSMTYTASETGLASRDDPGAWEFYSTGEWAFYNMTPRDYAHEVMHVFGLGDDYRPVYDAEGNFDHAIDRPGREGTLMDSGDLLDQDLVDRLGALLRQAEELPNCWVAKIRLQTDQTLPSGDTCQQTGDAQGELLVAANGRISGTLDAVETETCTFGFDRTRSGLTLALEGTASASALTVSHTTGTTTGYFLIGFFSAPGVLDPVPIPITAPGVAEGSVTREMPNDYTITLTFDFRCVTCEAAVG